MFNSYEYDWLGEYMVMENDKFYIPEKILNMTQKEIRSEKESIYKYREELKQFRELCEEIKRVMPITDAEIELLDKAAMFWNVYEQIVWERDIAISQLEELGLSLGEKVDHVKELIDTEPQWISCSERLPKEKGWYQCTCRDNEIWNTDGIVRDLYWYPSLEEFVDNIRYERNNLKEIEKFFWTKYVVAWMPLPEPYKGE